MNRSSLRRFTDFVLFAFLLFWPALRRPVSAQTRAVKSAARSSASGKLRYAIALAESAGPEAVSRNAGIVGCDGGSCADMNELAKGPAKEFRSGTNG